MAESHHPYLMAPSEVLETLGIPSRQVLPDIRAQLPRLALPRNTYRFSRPYVASLASYFTQRRMTGFGNKRTSMARDFSQEDLARSIIEETETEHALALDSVAFNGLIEVQDLSPIFDVSRSTFTYWIEHDTIPTFRRYGRVFMSLDETANMASWQRPEDFPADQSQI